MGNTGGWNGYMTTARVCLRPCRRLVYCDGLSLKAPPLSAAPRSQVPVVRDVFVAKLDANGSFDSVVISDDPDLTINTQANTTFGGTVSDLATLTTDAGGSTIAKADITTTGNQTYNDRVCTQHQPDTDRRRRQLYWLVLMVMATTSPLNFTGNATLDWWLQQPISGINNLTSLGGVATNGTITTTGAQSFEGNATLIGNTTLVGPSATLAGTFDGQGIRSHHQLHVSNHNIEFWWQHKQLYICW